MKRGTGKAGVERLNYWRNEHEEWGSKGGGAFGERTRKAGEERLNV